MAARALSGQAMRMLEMISIVWRGRQEKVWDEDAHVGTLTRDFATDRCTSVWLRLSSSTACIRYTICRGRLEMRDEDRDTRYPSIHRARVVGDQVDVCAQPDAEERIRDRIRLIG